MKRSTWARVAPDGLALGRRPAPGCATAACRRRASGARTPSAAGARPGTICPALYCSMPPGANRACSRRIRSSAMAALGRPDRRRVPLGLVAVVDRDEGGLAADGEPDVARLQPRVDGMAGGQDLLPLGLVVGLGDARLLEDAPHAHLEAELDLARVDRAGDRCGAAAGRACRPAAGGPRRRAGPRSGRARSSRRRAGRPRSRRAGR